MASGTMDDVTRLAVGEMGRRKKDGLTEMDTLDFALAIEDVGSA